MNDLRAAVEDLASGPPYPPAPRALSHLHVLAFCFVDHAVGLDETLRPYGMRAFASLGLPQAP